ncbi:hypothetical protein ACTOB_001405 [Actinoplanes oblitus]|uniref:Uncharacterized protein n=1 Tax=Actinoplanes oblitus TaxID=3040509 RepID=A0ABY8WIZ5_9ACTN|nr:hypothetical protein [Actinoplanes oblitus]WIM97851.1 hypothetical protein ACTOB_001405 [Actinoplanes oblitus]
MSAWTWAWLAWGAIFCAIEGMALFNSRSGDTLSEHAWAWLGYAATGQGPQELRRPSGWTRLRRFLLLAGLAWLVVHLLTGGVF